MVKTVQCADGALPLGKTLAGFELWRKPVPSRDAELTDFVSNVARTTSAQTATGSTGERIPGKRRSSRRAKAFGHAASFVDLKAQTSLPAGNPALRSAFELWFLPSVYIGLLPNQWWSTEGLPPAALAHRVRTKPRRPNSLLDF